MGFFEKYLTLWVALCIIVGVALGYLVPGIFQIFGRIQLAQINLPVAVLIWLMIIPMLIKIDLTALSVPAIFSSWPWLRQSCYSALNQAPHWQQWWVYWWKFLLCCWPWVWLIEPRTGMKQAIGYRKWDIGKCDLILCPDPISHFPYPDYQKLPPPPRLPVRPLFHSPPAVPL